MDEIRCDRCHSVLSVGQYPFCKGNPVDHGPIVSKTSVFPYETTNVNGQKMTIESLAHLRKVERDYGVVFSAFSKSNVRDLDPIHDLPQYRGDNSRR